MSLPFATETIPLQKDREGVIRVGGTRVTLETVIHAFNEGSTAEEIVFQYPSLDLADVYAVIAYYLRHQAELDAYVQKQEEESRRVRQENEARFDPRGIRDRLLARRNSSQG
jgi:uncharacterized protein (DUF433 family)